MVEKGIVVKRGKKSSGKCCCALFTIVIIVAIGAVAFIYREKIIEKFEMLNGSSNDKLGDEEHNHDFDETMETTSSSLPQESMTDSLEFSTGYYDIDLSTVRNDYDTSDSSDESKENENKRPSIQESDSNESDDYEEETTKVPIIFTHKHIKPSTETTQKHVEETTERKEVEDVTLTILHEGSGLGSNGFTKSKMNKTMETDDEDYQVEGSSQ